MHRLDFIFSGVSFCPSSRIRDLRLPGFHSAGNAGAPLVSRCGLKLALNALGMKCHHKVLSISSPFPKSPLTPDSFSQGRACTWGAGGRSCWEREVLWPPTSFRVHSQGTAADTLVRLSLLPVCLSLYHPYPTLTSFLSLTTPTPRHTHHACILAFV